MEDKKVSRVYAQAIYNMAKDNDSIFSVLEMLDVLLKHINEDSDFKDFLSYPIIDCEDKKKLINAIYEDIKDISIDILDYLIDKNRLIDIKGIKEQYLDIYYENHNKLIVTAIFAKPISTEQEQRLIEKLEKLKKKKILLHIKIDESIIAGGIIKIGDEVIDGSFKSQIKIFKNMF
ncbi:ATP synthase F1 subunit delta [Caviibacter abscessus]|uniref:ATP synthase F1 subunit delta n=1 Tax=Caviibacter abscessus TaxID=1766719 RepID=UPI000836582C|nr:ATP synthase F1 subunit delta [Caviibacter abscessus]